MKLRILFALYFCFACTYAQIEDAWVYFTNKPDASNYLNNPLSMLTQRALDRRVAQNIPLNHTDVPVHQPYIDQIENANGITVMAKSKWLNCVHIRGLLADIQALTSLSFVSSIYYANKNLNAATPRINYNNSNQVFTNTKNMEVQTTYNYGSSANQIQMLNGHFLHQQNYLGQGKVIAVLDSGFTGVDTAIPFQGLIPNKILGGYNFPDRNTNYFSRHNHGTLVLSTIGGNLDGQLVGTAPEASYYLFISEDVNSENPVEESYWVEAAELADYYGADIINSSLGYFLYDNPNYSYTYDDLTGTKGFASRGANIAFAKGMVVVVSAGNSGATANPHISVPADAMGALTVGAVNSTELITSFSSIGPTKDNRIKPDVCAKGSGATVSNTAGNIVTASGTSFSSPIIAGMVACLWSVFPNYTAQQIVDLVKQSSDRYTNPVFNYGYGIPDFQQAAGLLNTNDFLSDDSFSVYPNPMQNILQVNVNEENSKGTIQIINALGQVVLQKEYQNTNEAFINVENLSNAMYFIKIISNKIFQQKIVKN
jgi:serine protease AprX